jgi:uncharacterized ferredoxin-like protein
MKAMTTVAELMAIAARTAPKAKGEDFVVVSVLEGDRLQQLGEGMIDYGRRAHDHGFVRDGRNVLGSAAIVIIGVKDAQAADLNCGACGEDACIQINTHEGQFKGPQCALRVLDMGIALGSAAKVASLMNVDNRIMYRVGVVAREKELVDADFVIGIPLSATGKNIYFDRTA